MLFKYEFMDAWLQPIAEFTVQLDSSANTVSYRLYDESMAIHSCIEMDELTASRLEKIIQSIPDDVFASAWLEYPPDVEVLDGYCHRFTIDRDTDHVQLCGSNISYCCGRYDKAPNAAACIAAVDAMAEILKPIGVPEGCFWFEK
ncbi:MAG: hypothetical protein Q4F00_05945 [bacterium]|nr:hypothetical protein [bacterium]